MVGDDENKEKFGKPKSIAGFNVAITEVEEELSRKVRAWVLFGAFIADKKLILLLVVCFGVIGLVEHGWIKIETMQVFIVAPHLRS